MGTLKKLLKDKYVCVGFSILSVIIFLAILGPFFIATDPNEISFVSQPIGPSLKYVMGSDDLGRDIFTRIVYGSRISLIVAFVSVLISLSIGTIVGAIAGYYRGIVDEVIMRVLDMLMAIPTIFLLLTIQVILKPSIFNVMIVIGLTSWMGVARIVRGEVLSIAERDYVRSAIAFGHSQLKVLFVYVLPNAFAPLLVTAILGMGSAILTESALSYFGLGVQPPHPSWGNMLYNAQEFLLDAWWMTLFPGLFILITVLSLNFVGDGIGRILNPRQ